jgi:hypothetical protein
MRWPTSSAKRLERLRSEISSSANTYLRPKGDAMRGAVAGMAAFNSAPGYPHSPHALDAPATASHSVGGPSDGGTKDRSSGYAFYRVCGKPRPWFVGKGRSLRPPLPNDQRQQNSGVHRSGNGLSEHLKIHRSTLCRSQSASAHDQMSGLGATPPPASRHPPERPLPDCAGRGLSCWEVPES